MFRILFSFNRYCSNGVKMKYLNVAEKNDAAKTIAGLLSNGSSARREGLSKFNKIYEFPYNVRGQNSQMVMTSVSGHLLQNEFISSYRNWKGCNPEQLFDAQIVKSCPDNYVNIKKTLEREVRSCNGLIIWTDGDREGENIGFEIIEVCLALKPGLPVYRAKFSDITAPSVKRALLNLVEPDARQNDAVEVRKELDLRIGAAFTRLQTLRLQAVFPTNIADNLVSYGSCQIPTLGFVVHRYKEAENFIPQAFWKIKLNHKIGDLTVEFNWARNRLFDRTFCEALLRICQAAPLATVLSVSLKPKSKWRPLPLDTVELEKLGSRKLKLTAKQTMTIAEKLYTQGYISYPRTETNMFSADMQLRPLVENHTPHPDWGAFATKVLEWGPNPRKGSKSDQAHPPIHPTKFTAGLNGDEKKVYELVVRHFLACVSRDATGSETIVTIDVADEEFTATGLVIHERNYLEVYWYDRWAGKEIHAYEEGATFEPTELDVHEGATSAPALLTEADLITLMEKHGIGTDATHAEHINTVKERGYIGEIEGGRLVPGTLGMGLVEGYEAMTLTLAEPKLRAGLELDLKLICEGRKDPKVVLAEQIEIYRAVFKVMTEKVLALDGALGNRFNAQPRQPTEDPISSLTLEEILKCPKCNRCSLALKQKKDNAGYFLSCLGFPDCKNTIWLSDMIREVTATSEVCSRCGPGFRKLKFKFKQQHTLALLGSDSPTHYTACLVCDGKLRDVLGINVDQVKRVGGIVGAGAPTPNRGPTNPVINRPNTTNTRPPPPSRNTTSQPMVPARPTGVAGGGWNSSGTAAAAGRTGGAAAPGGWGSSGQNSNRPSTGGSSSWGSSSATPNTNASWNGTNNSSGWGSSSAPANPAPAQPNPSASWSGTNNSNNNRRQSAGSDGMDCPKCNIPARKLTTKKEGPNKGRKFYVCPNKDEPNSGCNFFKWADEVDDTSGGGGGGPGPGPSGGGNSAPSWSRNNNDDTGPLSRQPRPTTKRKCGICRQEGHTKLKCPRRDDVNL